MGLYGADMAALFPNAAALSDALSNPTATQLAALGMAWNHVTGKWERISAVVDVFKTVTGTTGTTNIWAPASGKKFRLRGLDLEINGLATQGAASVNTITVKDGSTNLWQFSVLIDTAATADKRAWWSKRIELPANGYLASAADAILSVALGTALTAGSIRANAWGREE
jgi:hypothetical protein